MVFEKTILRYSMMCKSPKILYMEKLSIYASISLKSRHLDDLETLVSDTSLHNNEHREQTIAIHYTAGRLMP